MRHITLKSIIAGALLLCTGWSAKGEDFDGMQISVRAGLGGSPVAAQNYYKNGNYSFDGYSTYYYPYYYPLSVYYGDYYGPAYTSGAINIGVDFRVIEWLGVGVDVNTTPIWHDKYNKDGAKIGHNTGVSLSILPMVTFYYFRRPVIMLYGRVGMGFGYYFNYPGNNNFKFEIQAVPFGFELGRKVFWFAEFGIGTAYIGGQTGIGYRF